uniref:Uncharacterized protein n=1 Tax=Meloidogyne incognita TaxID=6306 RepID=A0A914LNJ3_MELIC
MSPPTRTIEDVYNEIVAVRTSVTQIRTDVDAIIQSVRRVEKRNLEFAADLETLGHSVHHLSGRVQALELNRDEENQPPVVRPAGNVQGENGGGGFNLNNDNNVGGHNGGGLN